MAHRGRAIGIDFEPGHHGIGDAELLQNLCHVNPAVDALMSGTKTASAGQKGLPQCGCVLDRDHGIAAADAIGGFHQPDVDDRGANDKIFSRQIGNDLRRQDDDVGRRALAYFIGHGADRAEFAGDVEPGQCLEVRRKARDQALRRAAAENVQACS